MTSLKTLVGHPWADSSFSGKGFEWMALDEIAANETSLTK
jgi:hypothetical protein